MKMTMNNFIPAIFFGQIDLICIILFHFIQ